MANPQRAPRPQKFMMAPESEKESYITISRKKTEMEKCPVVNRNAIDILHLKNASLASLEHGNVDSLSSLFEISISASDIIRQRRHDMRKRCQTEVLEEKSCNVHFQ
jgi:hypothetical protein